MTEPSHADALPAQYRLHWYVLERVLGQGGFGITYLARDTNLDQQVAIKEYLPVDVATRRPDASVRSRTEDQGERYRWGLDRFIREARTLAKFDHPNIVRVHSVFEVNNTAYMVMRFEEGENLAALLERRRTLPEEELLRVVLPILDGLELVHGAGFIHRDIKPDNIHIRDDGSPVLLDFGSARHSLGHARTVTILVAPGYAPFEQYHSSGESQGPWTDLYSLGATCYRAISGIAPLDAISRSKGILGSTREMLVPAANIGSGRYSPGLLKAIDHALEFAEKDRPQSIAEWRKELTAESKPSTRTAPPTTATAPAATPAAAPAAPLRGPLIWATLGALVAAAAVVMWLAPKIPLEPMKPAPPPRTEIAIAPQSQQEKSAAIESQRRREEEATKLAAAQNRRQELETKLAALEARVKNEAEERHKADAERSAQAARARSNAESRRQADAERKRQDDARRAEAARRTDEAKRADEARRAEAARLTAVVAAVPKKPAVQAAPPAPDLVALAEQARARGNDAESLSLLRKAADQGNAKALLALGEMYGAGRGVPQNNFQAYVWFSRAARAGNTDAKARAEQVKSLLQPAEVQQADRLIR